MEEEQISYMLVKVITTRSGKSSIPVDYNYVPKEWSDEDMIIAFEAGEDNREPITKYQKQGQDEWLTEYKKQKEQ